MTLNDRLRQAVPPEHRQRVKRLAALAFRGDLDRLARLYDTDKGSHANGYTAHYARHLPPRQAVRTLMEIGIGGVSSWDGYETPMGGASLRMWQDYYPQAWIVGVDLHEKHVAGDRIVTEQGSQDDPAFLADLAARYGPFDVVIDDGSHVGRHQWVTFEALFPHVRPGGVYVVEDTATAYRPEYEGGPPGTPRTAASLLRDAVDAVHRRHWGDGWPIADMHVYDGVAFLTRS